MKSSLVVLLPVLFACSAAAPPALADAQNTGNFSWQKKIDAPVRLEVRDLNGALTIEASADDTLSVVAVKTKRDAAQVNVTVKEENGVIVVCALWPGQTSCSDTVHGSDIKAEVEFTVKAPPKITQVLAETMNGAVAYRNVAAPATLRTMNGAIDVKNARGAIEAETMNGAATAEVKTSAAVKLSTKNGRVELSLPPDANADVEASTMNGTITAPGASGDANVVAKGPGPATSKFRLGSGGPHVDLKTMNGAIVVKRGT